MICRSVAAMVLLALGCTAGDPRPKQAIPASGELTVKCDDDNPNQECAEPADNALWINSDNALGIVGVRRDAGSVQIELTDSSPLKEWFRPGVVLARNGEKPFLVRIDAVEQTGNVYRMVVSPAQLQQLFTRARIHRRYRVGESVGEPIVPQRLRGSSEHVEMISQSLGTPITIANCTHTFQPALDGVSLTVAFSPCSFDFAPALDVIWEWPLVTGPDQLELSLSGSMSAKVGLHSEISSAVSTEEQALLTTINTPIPLPIPIPFSLRVELWGSYKVDVDAPLTADSGFEFTGNITAGLGYAKGDGVYATFESTKHFTPIGSTVSFTGDGFAKIVLKPRFEIEIFGVSNGYAESELYSRLNLDSIITATASNGSSTGEICHELKGGMAPQAGFSLEAFDQELASLDHTFDRFTTTMALTTCAGFSAPSNGCSKSAACRVNADCPDTDNCHVGLCESTCTCTTRAVANCCVTASDCGPAGQEYLFDCQDSECINRGAIARETAALACSTEVDCDDRIESTTDQCELTPLERFGGVIGLCSHVWSTETGYRPGLTLSSLGARALSKRGCNRDRDCDDGDPAFIHDCFAGRCRHRPWPYVRSCDEKCNDNDALTVDGCMDNLCTRQHIGIDVPFPR